MIQLIRGFDPPSWLKMTKIDLKSFNEPKLSAQVKRANISQQQIRASLLPSATWKPLQQLSSSQTRRSSFDFTGQIYDIILITAAQAPPAVRLTSSPWLGTGGDVDAGLSLVLLLAVGQRAAVDFWCPVKWSFLRRTRRVKAANTNTRCYSQNSICSLTLVSLKNRRTWIYFTFNWRAEPGEHGCSDKPVFYLFYFIHSKVQKTNARPQNRACF